MHEDSSPYKFGIPDPRYSAKWRRNADACYGVSYQYDDIFQSEQIADAKRLKIAAKGNHVDLLIKLLEQFPEPFRILYILRIPHSKIEAARYQSQNPLNKKEIVTFLKNFSEFFESDARADIWIKAYSDPSMLVYEHHNLIFAYGDISSIGETLRTCGLTEGHIELPFPHDHHYNPELDHYEIGIMKVWDWIKTPLMPEDF